MKHKETPWDVKALAGLTIAYALSPIDLIPDFIPVLGYLDDLIILPLLITLTIKLIPKDIWKECEEEAKELWKDSKPKKCVYAIPIIIFWLVITGIILYIIIF
jgi:uncharacterized membrane protein YkvA (DUF1232 family)